MRSFLFFGAAGQKTLKADSLSVDGTIVTLTTNQQVSAIINLGPGDWVQTESTSTATVKPA